MRILKRYEGGGVVAKKTPPGQTTMDRLNLGITPPKRDDKLTSFERVDRDPTPTHAQIHRSPDLRTEAGMTALNMAPVIGDVMLAGRTARNLYKGNYKDALVDVALRKTKTGLPSPLSAAVKRGIKKEIKS